MDIHNFFCYKTRDLAILIQDSFSREEKKILVYNMALKVLDGIEDASNFQCAFSTNSCCNWLKRGEKRQCITQRITDQLWPFLYRLAMSDKSL